jgi:hypothetical protein
MSRTDEIWNYVSDDEDDTYPEPDIFHYQGKYLYDYQWHHENFPQDWATCYQDGTGPSQCVNCADYGSINGVFIGYCANCAFYVYKGSRGRGFMGDGVECALEDVLGYKSVFDTYLKDVNINSIIGLDNSMPEDYRIDNPAPHEIDQSEFTDVDIYGTENVDNGEPIELSVFDCHFEGGYNDM